MSRFEREMQEAEVVRQVVALAGYEPSHLVSLDAVSDKQRDFAGWIRFSAIADIWENIKQDYRTPEFARVIIAAINRHKDAKWWCERESMRLASKAFLFELRADIKAAQVEVK